MSEPSRIEFKPGRFIFIDGYVKVRPYRKRAFVARIKSWDLNIQRRTINHITVWGGPPHQEQMWTLYPDCIVEAFTEKQQAQIIRQKQRSE